MPLRGTRHRGTGQPMTRRSLRLMNETENPLMPSWAELIWPLLVVLVAVLVVTLVVWLVRRSR